MRFLADLALFVEVANTGNFGRAAAALGMPASTLSRRIGALEKELGFQLIHGSSTKCKSPSEGGTGSAHLQRYCSSIAETIASPLVGLNSRITMPSLGLASKLC